MLSRCALRRSVRCALEWSPRKSERPHKGPTYSRSGAHTPGNGVTKQRDERVAFPRAVKGQRRRIRKVDPRGADRWVVTVAQGDVGHLAVAGITGIADDPSPTVRLQ